MAIPDLLPPADLLQRVSGVEEGLRRRRRLGLFGLVALAVQGTLLVASSQWWKALTSADWAELRRQWPLLLILLLAVMTLLLVVAMRFWLQESRQPFRYTYSVGDFKAVLAGEDRRLSWLRYDLTEHLSVRIGRLSLREDASASGAEGGGGSTEPAKDAPPLDSHIHISGYYLIRKRPDDPRWTVEVTPWVRIGPAGSPATLAIPVKHYLGEADAYAPCQPEDGEAPEVQPEDGEAPEVQAQDGEAPEVQAQEYEQILEWTYFSVATQIYKRIREDVQRKIELLPSDRFRAAAYLYEADDYARSNTLDAYGDAAQLYDRASKLYDPFMRPLSPFALRRAGQRVVRAAAWTRRRVRRRSSYLWPRLGKLEVMQARAQIGYVNMLVNRRNLAPMAGQRATPIFEARPVAELAVRRLTLLPEEIPGRNAALFDALVALARVWNALGSVPRARKQLREARRLDPARSDQDVGYVLALGQVEARPRSRLLHYGRAVELDGQSELARFDLAYQAEMIWRQDQLEPALAEAIFDEYKRILRLNPGNISAWADVGYMHWLLAVDDRAKKSMRDADDAFKRGRDYREIKGETFVGELEYGLARIAAESGHFNDAYSCFTSAFSAYCAPGNSLGSPSTYYFDYIGDAIWGRMSQYVQHVRAFHENPSKLCDEVPATRRVQNAVLAFVLNDFGDACYSSYLRTGEDRLRDRARSLYLEAIDCSPAYAMPHYNLYLLEEQERYTPSPQGDESQIKDLMDDAIGDALARQPFRDDRAGHIERVIQLQPEWQDANLAMLSKHATIARREMEAARRLETKRKQLPRAPRRRQAEVWQPPADDYGGQSEPKLWTVTAPDATRATDQSIYRTAINDLLRDARKHQDTATRILSDLLPHAWLWRRDRNPEQQRFNFRVLRQRRLARGWRWEREFDDLHAAALYTWGETLLSPYGGRLAGRILHRRLDGRPRPSQALRVFDKIQRHFTPDLFTMLLHLREQANKLEKVNSSNELIRQTIRRYLADDPVRFEMLTWVNDVFVQPAGRSGRQVYRRTFGVGQRSQIFRSAAASSDLTASLYEWLGDSLMGLRSETEQLGRVVNRLDDEREGRDVPAEELVDALGLVKCQLDFEKVERGLGDHGSPRLIRLVTALTNRRDALLDRVSEALRDEFGQVNVQDLSQAVEHAYQQAVKNSDDPEQLCRLGEGLAKLGSWAWSCTSYWRARQQLRRSPAGHSRLYLDRAWHGIGRALWALNSRSRALWALDQIADAPEALDVAWRSGFVNSVRDEGQAGDRESDLLLRAWLEREQSGGTMRGEAARRDAGLALLTLAKARRLADGSEPVPGDGPPDSGPLRPVVTPIRLLADEGLFRAGARAPQVRRMLEKGIPDLKRRVKDRIGVWVPGVQISATDRLTDRQYRVMLHEVALARGTAPTDERFDRTMLEDLECVVSRYLDTFLGFHEAREMAREWARARAGWPDTRRVELVEGVFSDIRLSVCFVGALQRLVREQVPVDDLDPLFEVLAGIDWDSPGWAVDAEESASRIVEEVRRHQRIRQRLPGNSSGTRLLRVSAGVEDDVRRWVQEQDGKRFLAIPRSDLATLAHVVDALVERLPGGADGNVALVVRDAQLRRFVRRLVERDLPFLPVLAEQELLRGDAEAAPPPPEGARPTLDSLSILIGAPL